MQFVQYKEFMAILTGLSRKKARVCSCEPIIWAMKAVFVPLDRPSGTAWIVPVNNC